MLITSEFETFILIKNIQIKSNFKMERAFILYLVHNFKVGISLEIVLTICTINPFSIILSLGGLIEITLILVVNVSIEIIITHITLQYKY